MSKEYKTHLCTFMGRQNNLEILLFYVERALEIQAIDNYHMIDMTRTMHDHEYIHNEQQRLDKLFPGRVHLVNRKTRGDQLRDGSWKATMGSWSPFYKYCEQFNDNDIIIKCDDDTLYFDVSTLKAACKLRWENKDPFLMHANTINNGICAYHQAKKGVWSNLSPIINEYPTSGLTGPLFSHPDVACDCHEQFTRDIINNPGSVKKYKLKENIYFTARISINYIFMLGSDRKHLVQINEQDEYVTSSKIGQKLDRPNMIIGDFVAAHHTYGVQEPVMEERDTFKKYIKLRDSLKEHEWKNQEITSSYNRISTIKHDGNYLMKYWCTNNSYLIKNTKNDMYIDLTWDVREREKRVDKHTKIKTGTKYLNTTLSSNTNTGTIFNIDLQQPTVIQIEDCTEILKSSDPDPKNDQFLCWPVKMWFQQNYKKQLSKLHKQSDGTYLIESATRDGFYLSGQYVNEKKTIYRFKEHGTGIDTWNLVPLKKHANKIVLADIHKHDDTELENDSTTASTPGLPPSRKYREYYWMVNDYIWEFEKVGAHHTYIKIISDENKDMWLSYDKKSKAVTLSPKKQTKWQTGNSKLIHADTGKFLKVKNDLVTLVDKGGSQFRISI